MPGLYAQGYFVYDSHKSGAQTVSHLRFGPRPIRAPYLIQKANFVACHQFNFIERLDVLRLAGARRRLPAQQPVRPGRGVGSPAALDAAADHRPQAALLRDRRLQGRPGRRPARAHQHHPADLLLRDLRRAAARRGDPPQIKHSIEKTYGRKGADVVRKNFEAVDHALAHLFEVTVPAAATSAWDRPPIVPADAPDFVREVTAMMMAGRGDDEIPVSLMPVDGTFPSGTAAFEKRNIADVVPVWEPDLCIQCGQCSFVCPHSVIRAKYYDEGRLDGAPDGFKSAPVNARGFPDARFTLQFYVEDCTGCGLCVEACPAHSPREPGGQGDQPAREAAAGRGRTPQHRLLRDAAGERPRARRLRQCARRAVPRAAVRVLRRLRRLRRDALPQAAVAAVRRPPAGRQRHRLLVDLRRQPAGDAVGRRTPTAAGRPGRTRCSRTMPSSASASASPPTSISSWRHPRATARAAARRRPRRRHPQRPAGPRDRRFAAQRVRVGDC